MLVIVLSYLLGAIPAGYLLNRTIEAHTLRLLALLPLPRAWHAQISRLVPRAFSSCADLAKGAFIVWAVPALVQHVAAGQWDWLAYPLVSPGLRTSAVLVTMVVGHVLSVYICGWGGRGIATALGGFLVLTPIPACAAIALWLVLTPLLRSFRPSAIAASFALPVFIFLFQRLDLLYALAALVLAILSIMTHIGAFPVYHAHRREAS